MSNSVWGELFVLKMYGQNAIRVALRGRSCRERMRNKVKQRAEALLFSLVCCCLCLKDQGRDGGNNQLQKVRKYQTKNLCIVRVIRSLNLHSILSESNGYVCSTNYLLRLNVHATLDSASTAPRFLSLWSEPCCSGLLSLHKFRLKI